MRTLNANRLDGGDAMSNKIIMQSLQKRLTQFVARPFGPTIWVAHFPWFSRAQVRIFRLHVHNFLKSRFLRLPAPFCPADLAHNPTPRFRIDLGKQIRQPGRANLAQFPDKPNFGQWVPCEFIRKHILHCPTMFRGREDISEASNGDVIESHRQCPIQKAAQVALSGFAITLAGVPAPFQAHFESLHFAIGADLRQCVNHKSELFTTSARAHSALSVTSRNPPPATGHAANSQRIPRTRPQSVASRHGREPQIVEHCSNPPIDAGEPESPDHQDQGSGSCLWPHQKSRR